MMDFLLGSALIVLPQDKQIPLALATAVIKAAGNLRSRRRQRREREAAGSNGGQQNNTPTEALLEWSCLNCTLADKKSGQTRSLLKDVSGSASPGRLLAIMGPSGSGKTTLLSALAGQMPATKGMVLSGVITANGQPAQAAGVRSGFVQQDDLFYAQLTVRETLLMAAELRLPGDVGPGEREACVEGVIRRLGLGKAADTPVGDAKTRGLSGGEKKRLSIATELISRPMLVFADEPTSGLDAFAAERVMATLRDLTTDGHTVIASIHQPRSSIWAMFDDLLLLSEGEVVYAGPAADALDYFATQGYPCPKHFNPAEFLADLVAIDHSTPEVEEESTARLQQLVAAWRTSASSTKQLAVLPAGGDGGLAVGPLRPSCSLPRQVQLLFGRSQRQVVRDKPTNIGRLMSQISSAVVFGSVYWRLGRTPSSIQDRMGLLQVSAVGTAMSSLIKTLNVFPKERSLVARERARCGYSVLPYLVSKLAAELPIGALFPAAFAAIVYPTTGLNPKPERFLRFLSILTLESFSSQALGLAVGAAAPSTEAALAIGPAVILVSIVFGGLFVSEKNLPWALSFLPKTSLIKAAFEGACVNELQGEEFEGESGDKVLDRLSFGKSKVRGTLAAQGRILLFYWWATLCILRAGRGRYQPLEPPATAAQPAEDAADGAVAAPGAGAA